MQYSVFFSREFCVPISAEVSLQWISLSTASTLLAKKRPVPWRQSFPELKARVFKCWNNLNWSLLRAFVNIGASQFGQLPDFVIQPMDSPPLSQQSGSSLQSGTDDVCRKVTTKISLKIAATSSLQRRGAPGIGLRSPTSLHQPRASWIWISRNRCVCDLKLSKYHV